MESWNAAGRGPRAACAAALLGLLILLSYPPVASLADARTATAVFYVG